MCTHANSKSIVDEAGIRSIDLCTVYTVSYLANNSEMALLLTFGRSKVRHQQRMQLLQQFCRVYPGLIRKRRHTSHAIDVANTLEPT